LKIATESFTVVPHPADGELSLLMCGLRIVLDLDEARALTAQLISGMKAICRTERVGDRIARAPEPSVVDEPAVRQPAMAELEPAVAPASRRASAAVKELAVKELAVKEGARRDDGTAAPSSDALASTDPAALMPPQPEQGEAEAEKKSTKKLRSLFKALVKEDDSSFSGGL
jgi:hypothetical protein